MVFFYEIFRKIFPNLRFEGGEIVAHLYPYLSVYNEGVLHRYRILFPQLLLPVNAHVRRLVDLSVCLSIRSIGALVQKRVQSERATAWLQV